MRNPKTVQAVQFRGVNVMAGIYEDGSIEVRTWAAQPVTPESAAYECVSSLGVEVDR